MTTTSFFINTVCDNLGLEPSQLQTSSRKRDVVQARQMAMYLIRKYTSITLKEIGRAVGGRNYATVICTLKVTEDLMSVDKQFRAKVNEIEGSIKLLLKN